MEKGNDLKLRIHSINDKKPKEIQHYRIKEDDYYCLGMDFSPCSKYLVAIGGVKKYAISLFEIQE
jgi:hypothetical protein